MFSKKHSARILHVEDDPLSVQSVQHIINSNTDYELLFATTAEQGLSMARRHLPDMILLDISLPTMDGYELLEHLKCNFFTRDIPVIGLSLQATSDEVQHGINAGFSDYISKPCVQDNLLNAIEMLLKNNARGASTQLPGSRHSQSLGLGFLH